MIKFPRPRSYIDRPLPRQGMDDRKREELRDAHHSEKSGHVRDRMLAVHCVVNMGMTHEDTADTLMRCPGWVGKWVARYREGGLPALRDLPRSGRPLAVPRTALDGILADASGSPTTPAAVRDRIAGAAGTLFHIASVRRLMREFGLSRKRPRKAHVNRASASAVRSWQRRLAGAAPRLARAGYTMLVQDESIIVNDAGGMATHWTPRTVPVYEPYTGSHERIVVYGAIAEDGRQAFRTRDKFNADTFAQYLAELHGKFGKIAVIVDRAPQHRAGAVKDLLRANGEIKLIELPVGSPQLSAIEGTWRILKRDVRVPGQPRTLDELRIAVGEYLRTKRFNLNIYAYLNRKVVEGHTNFSS